MPHTFDNALDNVLIHVVSRNESAGLFVIRLGDLVTPIEIRLGREIDNERTHFQVSHAIKTPVQATPYRTSRPFGDDPGHALYSAIHNGILSYYVGAVTAGHVPSEDWLVDY
jgi:hypothetical protein